MLVAAFAGLVGLMFGSFANVVIDRWPRGGSVVRPRSQCDGCTRPLAAWEMVPVAGAAGAAGFLFLLWLVHPGGMGLGDVKLAALIGAVLGVLAIPALFLAFAAGAALGVVLLARLGPRARKVAVPFGPFLAAGAVAALVIGPRLVDWYSGTLA